jgi:hypothetical protein
MSSTVALLARVKSSPGSQYSDGLLVASLSAHATLLRSDPALLFRLAVGSPRSNTSVSAEACRIDTKKTAVMIATNRITGRVFRMVCLHLLQLGRTFAVGAIARPAANASKARENLFMIPPGFALAGVWPRLYPSPAWPKERAGCLNGSLDVARAKCECWEQTLATSKTAQPPGTCCRRNPGNGITCLPRSFAQSSSRHAALAPGLSCSK